VGYGLSVLQKGTEIETPLGSDDPPIEVDIDFEGRFSSLNKYDNGMYSGIGLGFNFGKNQIFFEGNYYHSLKDFDDNNTSENRSLQIGIGFVRNLSF